VDCILQAASLGVDGGDDDGGTGEGVREAMKKGLTSRYKVPNKLTTSMSTPSAWLPPSVMVILSMLVGPTKPPLAFTRLSRSASPLLRSNSSELPVRLLLSSSTRLF